MSQLASTPRALSPATGSSRSIWMACGPASDHLQPLWTADLTFHHANSLAVVDLVEDAVGVYALPGCDLPAFATVAQLPDSAYL